MEWLWILLRYLFPLDPVRQCIAALCDRVAVMVELILNDDALDELAADPDARIALEAALIDYEATLRLTVSARAHQIAKIRFIPGKKHFHRQTRARSLIDLVKRIRVLALDCADIERLAQLQAVRLKRAHNADPLSAITHAPSLRASPLRLDAAHRSTSPGFAGGGRRQSSTAAGGGGGLRALARKTEGAAQRAATARAPPIFHAIPHQPPRLAATCEVATPYPTPIRPNRGSLPPWPRARISSNSSLAAAWPAPVSKACSTALSPTTSTR